MNRLGRGDRRDDGIHDLLARDLSNLKGTYSVFWSDIRETWEVHGPEGWIADARLLSQGVTLANEVAGRALPWSYSDDFLRAVSKDPAQ